MTLASNTIQPLPRNNSDKWIDSVIESVLSACASMTDEELLTSFRPSSPLVKRDEGNFSSPESALTESVLESPEGKWRCTKNKPRLENESGVYPKDQ
ncbi:hypothetical protein ACTXT7_005618 [Hymenolepis weldensis]